MFSYSSIFLLCQVLFLELRKFDKLAEFNVFEADWLKELVRELIESIFVWISNNKEIWETKEESSIFQHSDVLNQVYTFALMFGELLAVHVFSSRHAVLCSSHLSSL